MSLARLVVIEGPDAGREFELPLRGGRIGRGAVLARRTGSKAFWIRW